MILSNYQPPLFYVVCLYLQAQQITRLQQQIEDHHETKKNMSQISIISCQPQTITNPSSQSNQMRIQKEFHNSNSDTIQIIAKTDTRRFVEPWTQEQITILYEKYLQYGPKWANMSKQLNKSQLSVKNKFYGSLRKLCRRLSYVGSKFLKPKNAINEKAFFRAFEARNLYSQPFEGYKQQQKELQGRILQYAKLDGEDISIEDCKELIESIHRFNTWSRPYKLKRMNRTKTGASLDEQSRKIQNKLELNNVCNFREEIKSQNNDIRLMDNSQIEQAYNVSRGNDSLELQVLEWNLFLYIS